MNTTTHIFGAETELALVAWDAHGSPMPPREAIGHFHEMAARDTPHLSDGGSGMFLRNAARLYRDSSGDADHLEYATPETDNPWDTVRHVLAGEMLMLGLANKICENGSPIARAEVFKHSANYGGGRSAAWGAHESYLFRRGVGDLQAQILPFLVSRIILTGAGGFDPNSPGIKFLLSPRVAQLKHCISSNTTFGRGIFNTRDESLTRDEAFGRLHLICGEGNMSQTSMWLKIGTTAIVVAMIGGGLPVGRPVLLKDPLRAMRRFAGDPSLRCRSRAIGAGLVSAQDIQRHYLEQAESNLGAGFMPAWAGDVCRLWRGVLDLEAGGAGPVSDRLDWAIKYALMTRMLESRGFAWNQLKGWNRLASRVQRALRSRGEGDVYLQAHRLDDPDPAIRLAAGDADLGRFRSFLKLRDELFELDIRLMQVGEEGLFSGLDRAGVLRHQVDGVDRIEEALTQPPRGTRAEARGKVVGELAGKPNWHRILCGWSHIHDQTTGRSIDLGSPFETRATWGEPRLQPRTTLRTPNPVPGVLLARALTLYDQGDLDSAHHLFSQFESYLARRRGSEEINEFHRHFSWVAARRGCGAKARELIVRLWGPAPEDGGDPPAKFQQILDWTLVHRYRALGATAAHPDLGRWISYGLRWIAEPADSGRIPQYRRASFLSHAAMWRAFVESRPDEACAIYRDGQDGLEPTGVHPFARVRLHLDGARLHILTGDFAAADQFLDMAHDLCGRNQFAGEKSLVLLLRAQSAYAKNQTGNATSALAMLDEARAIVEAKPNAVTSARIAAAAARIGGRTGPDQSDTFRDLVGRRDALQDCPLAQRILSHWDEWIDGFSCEEATGVDRDWWGL